MPTSGSVQCFCSAALVPWAPSASIRVLLWEGQKLESGECVQKSGLLLTLSKSVLAIIEYHRLGDA